MWDRPNRKFLKKMYVGVFNQLKMANPSRVDCSGTFFFHNVFSFDRSQAAISLKKICNNGIPLMIHKTDLLIGAIVI